MGAPLAVQRPEPRRLNAESLRRPGDSAELEVPTTGSQAVSTATMEPRPRLAPEASSKPDSAGRK
jgi:hypothetical protein